MFKKTIITAALLITAMGAQAETPESTHEFKFTGHVDEICGFTEISGNGKVNFSDNTNMSSMALSNFANSRMNDDENWIFFKIVANTREGAKLTVETINSDGFDQPIDESHVSVFTKNSINNVNAVGHADEDAAMVSQNELLKLGLIYSGAEPVYAGDYSITPVISVTCGS